MSTRIRLAALLAACDPFRPRLRDQSHSCLMGQECEYGISGSDRGQAYLAERVSQDLLRIASGLVTSVPGATGNGVFLSNGGRLYCDTGGHLEYCTPEVASPQELVRYDQAGDHLLTLARQQLLAENPARVISVLKNNLCPIDPDGVSYACHECYTLWIDSQQAAEQLVPHLVSRLFYAGSGRLTGRTRRAAFELSQRARHVKTLVGTDTMGRRPLICVRLRGLHDAVPQGWQRIQLLGKDSLRAPWGTFLTCGVTGLLISLLNQGHRVGKGLALRWPLRALRAFSLDGDLRATARLTGGGSRTAVQIQSEYLERAECLVQAGSGPAWGPQVVQHWRAALVATEQPGGLARKLDPFIKRAMWDRILLREGYTWSELHWGLRTLFSLRHSSSSRQAVQGTEGGTASGATRLLSQVEGPTRNRDVVDLALRLTALDVQYHELGGWYDTLVARGYVEPLVVEPAEVARAMREPPETGRAALRGALIRQAQGCTAVADWRFVMLGDQLHDLRDPFAPSGQPVNAEQFRREDEQTWLALTRQRPEVLD